MTRRILLVDDDEWVADTLHRAVGLTGLEVHQATCVGDAVTALGRLRIDVVVLEWALPDAHGPEAIARLRDTGLTCPVLVLTGRAAVEDKVAAFRAGADDFLLKTIDPLELLARLEAHIRRGSGAYSKLTAGSIALQGAGHEASVHGVAIDLTPIEFQLLTLLVAATGEILSRQELLDTVWKQKGEHVSLHTVSVHIARLRKKLGSAGRQIQTLPGVGYRFNAGA